jgi:AraC-like DNA-binding protein
VRSIKIRAVTGVPRDAELDPSPALRGYAQCAWLAVEPPGVSAHHGFVFPDACMDVIWNGTRLFVAGPDTHYVRVRREPGSFFVGLRFAPGLATCVLHWPANELTDARADLGLFWGRSAAELEERLVAASSSTVALGLLQNAVAVRVATAAAPDPLVLALVAHLRQRARVSVKGISRELAISERQLRRRCLPALGYGPKTLARVLRFQRFLRSAALSPSASLARLAAAAGYFDQAHLANECVRLAGMSPRVLVQRTVEDGRNFQDSEV